MNHRLLPLSQIDSAAVETLLDRAFGPDRQSKTAYRVRAGTAAIDALSFAALREDGALAGTIQCWPVEWRGADRTVPMIMVGPVAVDPRWQHEGLGKQLMHHMLDAVAARDIVGAGALMLIGDADYYQRFFGFSAERTGAWRLPGPFDPARLLARGDAVPAGEAMVAARFVPSDLPAGARLP